MDNQGDRPGIDDFGIETLFFIIPEAAIVVDPQSQKILLWNPAAERPYGYSVEEAQQLTADSCPSQCSTAHRAGILVLRAVDR
ncbi:MAG: PAS domain-containing protein [Dehalococcoidia bacterium]